MKRMNVGPYPVEVGLCLSSADWRREMVRKGPACVKERFPGSDGCVTSFRERNGSLAMVVTFRAGFRDRPLMEQVGIVAHEATHVWQNIVEHINEKRPGVEVEACSVQWIVQWLCTQLADAGWINT